MLSLVSRTDLLLEDSLACFANVRVPAARLVRVHVGPKLMLSQLVPHSAFVRGPSVAVRCGTRLRDEGGRTWRGGRSCM